MSSVSWVSRRRAGIVSEVTAGYSPIQTLESLVNSRLGSGSTTKSSSLSNDVTKHVGRVRSSLAKSCADTPDMSTEARSWLDSSAARCRR